MFRVFFTKFCGSLLFSLRLWAISLILKGQYRRDQQGMESEW